MSDSLLGLDEPPQPRTRSGRPEGYRVLARKYRPQSFAELIAKALNCIGPDGQGGPTIDPCGVCEPCRAIAEGRHIDVIEMDAASNTGVDDVREIIEAVRYAAVSARYKVYIVDEVHMLSKNAFNALLKTLEEPPAHVKFLFATTEVNKVPVTVLSRCQRFDLRRIPADMLAEHFRKVAEAEQVSVEPEALALIARAAEGSARDGLSILDQAIAHGEAGVTADQVRSMLGLSDRGAIRRLLGLLLAGDAPGALAVLKEQYDLGVEPSAAVRGLLEAVHGITRFKVGGGDDPALSAEEREAYADWAAKLSFAAVHRLWQLLLKGLSEVHAAPSPLEAAEMALLRVIHAAELPDPGELAAKLAPGQPVASAPSAPASPAGSERAQAAPPADFPAFVKLIEARGAARLALRLTDDMRLVDYAPPALRLQAARALDAKRIDDLLGELRAFTKQAFGQPWQIGMAEGSAQPSLREQELASAREAEQRVRDMPVVKAAFESFPDAELANWSLDDQRSA